MPNTLRLKTAQLANFADNSAGGISAQSALDMIHTLFPIRGQATVIVAGAGANLRTKCQADVVCDGVADNVEIQNALDARADDDDYGLTASRTWQETVKLVGSFTLASAVISVNGYTRVDASEAAFVLAASHNRDVFRNTNWNGVDPAADDSFITWDGGRIDGNKANQTTNATDADSGDPVALMNWKRVPHLNLQNVVLHDSAGMGYRVTGRYSGSETTESHTIAHIETYNNARRGHSIQNALRFSVFTDLRSQGDCTLHNTTDGGVWIGHSEAVYQGISVKDSGAHGLYINNVRHIQVAGLQVMDSYFHSVFVKGFVESWMQGQATGASGVTANTYSDFFFSNDLTLSYGLTKRCVFDVRAGLDNTEGADPVNQSAKAAIEFEEGAGAAGIDNATTGTPNQDIILRGMAFKGGGSSTVLILPRDSQMRTIDTSGLILQSQVGRTAVPKSTQQRMPGYLFAATISDSSDILAHMGVVTIATTGGNKTAKLPSIANAGPGHLVFVRKAAAANTATVTPQTGEKLDNVVDGSVVLSAQDSGVLFCCNGDDGWNIVAKWLFVGSGTGAILSGTTSIAITHAMGGTPAAKDITITPTNNPTNDPGHIYVDTIGATTFTVRCRADPGAATMTFGWKASL